MKNYESAKRGGFYSTNNAEFLSAGISIKDTSLIINQIEPWSDGEGGFLSNNPFIIKGHDMVNNPARGIVNGWIYSTGPGFYIKHNSTERINTLISEDSTALLVYTANGSINATIGSGDRVDFLKDGSIEQFSGGNKVFATDASGNIYSQNKLIKVDSSEFETHRIKLNYNFATDGVSTAKTISKPIPLGSIIKSIIIKEDTTLTSTSGTSVLLISLISSGEEGICTIVADNINNTDWLANETDAGSYYWGAIPFNEGIRIYVPADITGGTVTFFIEYIFNP